MKSFPLVFRLALLCVASATFVAEVSAADYLGRAYHMTASTSPNLSEVHIVNSSDSAVAFTGTLFHKSGSQLGDSNVSLHPGMIEPQGRLILFSSDLETLFNESPWTGPAMLDIRSTSQFDVMSKLSRNGRVTNTNCVRTGNVHNLEGTDSSDVSYIRFINDGATALSDIRGTLYDANGDVIGQSNAQFFATLGSREAIFLNRGQISNIVGASWIGEASLVLSDNYADLKLMNLNFVNDETFFNFSCYESADSGSLLGRAYHMTASTSPNLSEVQIINTSDTAQSFTGTLFHKSGDQLGASNVALHEGLIEPQGRLILFSTDLEQRFDELPWTGPAMLDVVGSSQFELMSKLSRNGRVTNTNCVRPGNVHNLEGTDSSDVSYIRFINNGTSALSDIRGTLYDANGDAIGTPNVQLFATLGAREAIFLNRVSIGNIVGTTWEGEASLVLSADYTNLQLMNLNFVNDETFFNFSCYEQAELVEEPVTVSARDFYESNIEPIIQGQCIVCHVNNGIAGATALIYDPTGDEQGIDLNFGMLEAYVGDNDTNGQTLLDKARGVNHGGGPQLSSDSAEFADLSTFLDLLGAETDSSGTLGSYWEGVSLLPPAETLRRASMILTGSPPSARLQADVANGGESALPGAIRELMTGDGFHEFLTRAANDRLLTDAYVEGNLPLDAADLNFPFFAIGADFQYEFYLANGGFGADVDRSWSRDWYWGLGRAPVELFAYIVANDRDYREVVTGDYYMVNRQSNEFMNAGATFNPEDPPNLFKVGRNNGQILQGDQLVGEFVNDTGFRVESHGDFLDYPQAGVLNTHAYLNRYPTTETNRNRARSRWTYYHFLGVDIEKSAARTTDPDALADTNNPTLNNPACTVCHTVMDPVAGSFQNYGNTGFYRDGYDGLNSLPDTYKYPTYFDPDAEPTEYVEGDIWYRDMRIPGFDGQIAPNNTNSVQWLGEQIAEDPRFATASVRFWWPALMGAKPVDAPEVSTDFDFSQRLAAFEEQNAYIESLGESFASGIDGGAAFNARDMLVELMMGPWFRADRAETEAVASQMVAALGTRRLLAPEELEKKSESLFGYKWGHWNEDIAPWAFDQTYSSLDDRYGSYYGGIDSAGVTERATALTPIMANVAEKHALEMSCEPVAVEFEAPDNQRTLFGGVTLESTPETDEAGIRDKIVELHYLFWGETHSSDDPEVDASYQLLADVWEERRDLNWTWYSNWPEESCRAHTEAFYADGGLGQRGDDPTFMRGTWSGLLIYLMTDYKFLHE